MFQFVQIPRDETPARLVDFKSWPRRDCIRSSIAYNEWFDYAELSVAGIEERLSRLSQTFGAQDIFLSGTLYDLSDEPLKTLDVVKIQVRDLEEAYFKAIWDDRSMPRSRPLALAAAARVVLVWDSSQNWIIINDIFYEIGTLAVFNGGDAKIEKPIFDCFDETILLPRFSRILKADKVVGLSEIERWR
jgi:hypothetical protein